MKTLSLKFRFAIVISTGALALVFGMGAISVHYAQQDLLASLSSQQVGMVSLVAADLDAKLKLATDSLAAAATAIPPEAIENDGTFDAYFARQPSLLQIFDDVLLVDAAGIVRADYPDQAGRIGVDVSTRSYFQRTMAYGEPVISEPVVGKVSGDPLIGVAAPIRDSKGAIVGMMVGLLRLTKNNFLGALSAARFGKTGYFSVLTTRPTPLYLSHPDPTRLMRDVSQDHDPAMAKALLATAPGAAVSTSADGSEVLISYRPLTRVNWVVTAVLPSAEAFAAIDRTRVRTIRIAIIVALLALPLVWVFAWRLLRPLTVLRTQVEHIAGDPTGTSVATAGPDEVGQVAEAFNAMLKGQRKADAQRAASETDRLQLVAILESSQDFVAVTDPEGHLTYVNASGRRLCGVGLNEDIRHTTLSDYFPPWATEKVLTVGVPAALAEGIWLGETAVLTVDGREVPVDHTLIAHRGLHGRVAFFASLLHDTSAAKAAAAAMRASEARMSLIADALPMLVAFMSCDYRLSFVNSRYEDHFGVARSTMLGKSIAELIGPDAYEVYLPYLRLASLGSTQVFEVESTAGVRRVHFVVKLIPQFDEDRRLTGYHFIHQDVTDHKAEHLRLSRLASADTLTGLLNRAGFEAAIDEAMQRTRSHRSTMALFYLDIDRFKSINDGYGHLVGDALLRAFAERLVHAVRSADIVARLGGDEFVVIAGALRSVDDLRAIARKILVAIRPVFDLSGVSLSITASIGVAAYTGADITAEELIESADAALYRAKHAGRNRYELHEPSQVLVASGDEADARAEPSTID